MSTDLLGIDIDRARQLTTLLNEWSTQVETITSTVTTAETLSDLPTNTHSPLDQIGRDGDTMASTITTAADALESFTISLDSPLTISAALTSVQSFNGTDNDPELDRRLRVLRRLIDAHTGSEAETATVMSQLLALDQSTDVRFRDTSSVDEARAELERLSMLEADGAISSNDPRLDAALRDLRTAVDAHTTGDAQTAEIVHAIVTNGEIATPTLIASVLTGHELETVAVAHTNGLDYDVANGLIIMNKVDELTASVQGMPPHVAEAINSQRRELLVELAGTDDPLVIGSLTALLGDGLSAIDAFTNVDTQIAKDLHEQQVDAVADAFGLDHAAAEARLADMQASTNELADRGWPIEDAAVVVQAAAAADLDLAAIEALANRDDSSLIDAANKVANASAAGMTTAEFEAYEGLIAHFDVFDNAKGGNTNELVTLGDLEYVVDHPDDFPDDVVAAAAAVIATPMLRHRIDTATDNTDVVRSEPFGNTRADDNAYSLGDLEQFQYKQAVNFLLGDHVDAIDVAQQGGDLSLVDGTHSKKDFQTFLDANRPNLDESEIAALELVIEAEWYDKGWWDEHKDSVALAAAVVAGGAIFIATGGTGSGISAILISSAYAAGTGVAVAGATTLTINALTGEELTDDLGSNMIQGGVGGLAGAGLVGTGSVLAGTGSLGFKTVAVLGGTADLSGLTSMGLFDPALDPFLDDIALDNLHDQAETTSYLTGAAALTGTVFLGGRHLLSNLADAPPPKPVDFTNHGGEFVDVGIRTTPLPEPPSSSLVPGGGLGAHEAVGGHTIIKHVGIDPADLVTRLANEPRIPAASTFTDRPTAEAAVSLVLADNDAAIQAWVKAGAPRSGGVFTATLDDPIGITIPRGTTTPQPASDVLIVLRPNPSLPDGYYILTAYPE